MKKILVTGGAGFIGSNLCKRLLAKGNQVTCLDNFYSSDPSNIQDLMDIPGFTFVKHNIIEHLLINNDFDEIYHLACPASPKQYQKDPIFTLDTNYLGSKNILEFARTRNSKVLLTSTSEVYGNPQIHPQPETYWGNVNPIGIRSCYDEGKRVSETLFVDYHRTYELPIRIARIFNTYGPRMNKDDGRVISNFINQALRNEDITVYGDGTQTRSFCYIDDMVNGLIKLMNSEHDFNGPINIGNPDEFTISQIATLVIGKIKSKSNIIQMELPIDDPRLRKPNIDIAKALLNWSPNIDIYEGLNLTIDYFRSKQ